MPSAAQVKGYQLPQARAAPESSAALVLMTMARTMSWMMAWRLQLHMGYLARRGRRCAIRGCRALWRAAAAAVGSGAPGCMGVPEAQEERPRARSFGAMRGSHEFARAGTGSLCS